MVNGQRRRYYDTKDVMEILKVGKRKANEIMHMFEERGQLFRDGKTMRVRIDYFEAWLDRKDGAERRHQVVEKKMRAAFGCQGGASI
jgi:hypothetical protein